MTNFIPIFPLKIVVYPGETLNLHIFEPRYRQMIVDCLEAGKNFGIHSLIESSTTDDLGTLMELVDVAHTYEDGRMDIRTKGSSVFQILHKIDEVPEKLYSGAIVTYPQNELDLGPSPMSGAIVQEVKRLYALLNLSDKFPTEVVEMNAYEIGHLIGLNACQELELLGLFQEIQRLEYIRRHLAKIVPIVQELEQMKARVQRNGHFRNLTQEGLGGL